MDAKSLLPVVKDMLGITGEYQNKTILSYINDTLYFMLDAGVPEKILESEAAIGVVARGVNDLWNYGMGATTFSPYFFQRVTQLAYAPKPEGNSG